MGPHGVNKERMRILEQAQRVVEQGGFKDLSMRTLAARLGFTATTIYRYFASKDELFLSLLVVGFTRLRDGILARVAGLEPPREQLAAGFDEYIRFGIEEKSYYNMMFASDYPECRPYSDAREEAASQEAQRISFDIIRLIGAVMGPDADEPERRIAAAWAMLHGFVSLHNSGIFGQMMIDVSRLRDQIVQHALDELLDS